MQTSNICDDFLSYIINTSGEIIILSILTLEFPPWRNLLASFRIASCKHQWRLSLGYKEMQKDCSHGLSSFIMGAFPWYAAAICTASGWVHSFHGQGQAGHTIIKYKKAMRWSHFTNISDCLLRAGTVLSAGNVLVDKTDGTYILMSDGREGEWKEEGINHTLSTTDLKD